MLSYDILELNYSTSEITFYFYNDVNKKIKVNVQNGFHEYVVAHKNLNYFIEISTGDLVRIPGADEHIYKTRFSQIININNNFYRRAKQSEVDFDDLIKFQGHNGKMYEHLEQMYKQ